MFTINTFCDHRLAWTTASPAAHFHAFTELPLPIWLHLNAPTTSKNPQTLTHSEIHPDASGTGRVREHLAWFSINWAFIAPQLSSVRSSYWINCVTLKHTHTHTQKHTVASGTKPSLPQYCVTTLIRGWTASQQAEGHRCPTIWLRLR